MTAAVLEKSAAESDQRDLLAVIHAHVPPNVGFTCEWPEVRAWIEARGLQGSNRVGALFAALAKPDRDTGRPHIHHHGYQPARRPAANGRILHVWEWQ